MMVKRFCVMFPDGSVSVMTHQDGEAAALARARRECKLFNKGERDKEAHATFGEIEISLTSYREKF
jgi:hypothetical protein